MNPLYEIRVKLGFNQNEMANLIQKKTLRKTDQQCISHWEQSERVPHFIVIKAYADIAEKYFSSCINPVKLSSYLNKLKLEKEKMLKGA